MRNRLAGLLALCISLALMSAVAQPLEGVWTGSIGKQSVTACFNAWDTGSYYYQRHLVPIHLDAQATAMPEATIRLQEYNGKWEFKEAEDGLILGTWSSSDKSRVLPIKLTKVKEFDGKPVPDSGACGSDAYNSALERLPEISLGPVYAANGVRYREVSIKLVTERARMLGKATIEILGEPSSVADVNESLRKLIPTTKGEMDELFGCRRAQLAATGDDGLLTQGVGRNVTVVGHWLMLPISGQEDCASAHPSVWETHLILDLRTGRNVDLFALFKDSELDENFSREGTRRTLPAPLAKFVYSRIGQGDHKSHLGLNTFKSCYYDPEPYEFQYELALMEDGIDFIVPITSNGSCGDDIRISFKELAPFLSENGKAFAAKLKEIRLEIVP